MTPAMGSFLAGLKGIRRTTWQAIAGSAGALLLIGLMFFLGSL